jgi:hypothetical protein
VDKLRQAAEMALQYFEDAYGLEDTEVAIKEALRQALDDKPAVKTYAGGKPNYCTPEVTREAPCKTDPRAPHGFDRNASHSADRYVCECEGWEPPKREWVGLTADEIWKCNKAEPGSAVDFHICVAHQNVLDFAEALEAKLKEKNCDS